MALRWLPHARRRRRRGRHPRRKHTTEGDARRRRGRRFGLRPARTWRRGGWWRLSQAPSFADRRGRRHNLGRLRRHQLLLARDGLPADGRPLRAPRRRRRARASSGSRRVATRPARRHRVQLRRHRVGPRLPLPFRGCRPSRLPSLRRHAHLRGAGRRRRLGGEEALDGHRQPVRASLCQPHVRARRPHRRPLRRARHRDLL